MSSFPCKIVNTIVLSNKAQSLSKTKKSNKAQYLSSAHCCKVILTIFCKCTRNYVETDENNWWSMYISLSHFRSDNSASNDVSIHLILVPATWNRHNFGHKLMITTSPVLLGSYNIYVGAIFMMNGFWQRNAYLRWYSARRTDLTTCTLNRPQTDKNRNP